MYLKKYYSVSLPSLLILFPTCTMLWTPFVPSFLWQLCDFNLPFIDWSGKFPTTSCSSSHYHDFLNFCADFSFSKVVTETTWISGTTANVLHLALTTDSNLASSITYLPGISDHSILQFSLYASACITNKATKQFLDYSKANFEAINNELAGFLNEYLLSSSERPIDGNWNLFKHKLNSSIISFIPQVHRLKHNVILV